MVGGKNPPLPEEVKKRLKSMIVELRQELEDDLGRELRRLGIDPTKPSPIPLSSLSYLTGEERAVRRALDVVLDKEQAAKGDFAAAVKAVIREAAYTHLNRLVGLKCLELRGHLVIDGEPTEAVTCRPQFGGRSKWLWTLRDRESSYRYGEDAEERLWREGLTRAYEAVTTEIRILFDPADPYAQVWPSYKVLRDVVNKLNELPDDAFRADELLGWVYQYFQSEEKDRVFEEVRTQKKKISGADIIAVTQLYTERYMVEFLLQNSLGRLWMEMYPDSEAKAAWSYYVEPATPHTRPPKPLKEWKILDPCVGSGHFLVVAFDMLVQLYAEERKLAEAGRIPREWAVPEDEVARTILERNLYGIDIDPRAVQLATLALYLKGKEAGLSKPPRINIVAADASFMKGKAWEDFLASFEREPSVRRVLEALANSLENIGELGSLLRPEAELRRIIAEEHRRWEEQVRRKAEENHLFPELKTPHKEELPFEQITDEMFWERLAYRVKAAIQGFMDDARVRGEIVDQVVAGEAQRGFAFLELCERRYDVVCTNPPYMGSGNMGKALKDFVAKNYPAGKRDLYAAFILRCRELAQEDGYVAMVTQQSWMFLRSFANLRTLPEEELRKAKPGQFKGLLREASIESLAHLGPGAFAEISGEVVNIALFTLRNAPPSPEHRMTTFRLIGPKSPEEKNELLKAALAGQADGVISRPLQHRFLTIPQSPLCYWLRERFFELLAGKTLGDVADVCQGLATADDGRFVRFQWEIPVEEWARPVRSRRWVPFEKGGGYGKWFGHQWWVVDWENDGERIKACPESVVRNERNYFKEGWTYSVTARGSLGLRRLNCGIFSTQSAGVIPHKPALVAVISNVRTASSLVRAMTAQMYLRESYISRIPFPERIPGILTTLEAFCVSLKRWLVARDPTERSFSEIAFRKSCGFHAGVGAELSVQERVAAVLHTLEGWSERLVFDAYGLDEEDTAAVLDETGTPAGWHPLIAGCDALPELPSDLPPSPQELLDYLATHERISPSSEELARIENRLRALYIAGPGAKVGDVLENENRGALEEEEDNEEEVVALGARIPIPAETFLEELSQKMEIHPVSIYWLLEEMRREEGLVCPPELKRHTEDYFSVKLLRMLGHRWPMQDQYEKERGKPFIDPKWVDRDGIIPLTPGTGEETLIERFRRFLDEEFGPEHGREVEIEAGKILGWKPGDEWGKQKPLPLERWFEREFFKRHVSQFKRRPIAWHLKSPKGTFQVIVYYHKFDKNCLQLLRARYVREVLESLRRQLAEAKAEGTDRKTLARVADLEAKIVDVEEFDRRLQRLLEGRDREARIWCPWKAPEEQPVGWDPDINDGVRVNIAPVQRLGLLAAPVLSKKDLNSLLAPEGRD